MYVKGNYICTLKVTLMENISTSIFKNIFETICRTHCKIHVLRIISQPLQQTVTFEPNNIET